MKDRHQNSISALEILQLMFIAFKITNLIHWKWIWVLSPTWIALLIILYVIWRSCT